MQKTATWIKRNIYTKIKTKKRNVSVINKQKILAKGMRKNYNFNRNASPAR